jgi:hypothetical protein
MRPLIEVETSNGRKKQKTKVDSIERAKKKIILANEM